jgi:LmbE family N-acetylglucosaminyl deacetylase
MNVLAVGAHFDDLELGCGGTLVKHVANADNVLMVVITDSAYSNPANEIIRDAETAMAEGKAAAEIIGGELLCLNLETFNVPFDESLTLVLNNIISERKIDTVYSHWIHDIHRDHQNAGRCAMMAARHVPRFLMYRSNYYDADQEFASNFYSDISEHMLTKIKAIKAHKSELERVRYSWIEFFEHQNRNDGYRIGVKYAEAFQVVRYLI